MTLEVFLKRAKPSHETRTYRNNQEGRSEMNASVPGSADWWTVVLSMPNYEALEKLHAYKNQLLEENTGKAALLRIEGTLSRCKTEIKRINILNDGACWYTACRDVLPKELFDEVLTHKRLLEKLA